VGPHAVAIRRDMRCSPCYFGQVEQCPRALACLTGLRPQAVYDICRRLLALEGAGDVRTGGGPAVIDSPADGV
jgi:hypothetical protein